MPNLPLELLRCHRDRLRAWQPDDAPTSQLCLLVEHRRKLVGDRKRLTNPLTGLLKECFPQALEWAGDLRRPAAGEFLRCWLSLAAALRASSASTLPEFSRVSFYGCETLSGETFLLKGVVPILSGRSRRQDLACKCSQGGRSHECRTLTSQIRNSSPG